MKTFLLVVLMALCSASLSYAKDPLAVCLESCRGKAYCLEDCAIKTESEQRTGIVHQQQNDPVGERHDLDTKQSVPPKNSNTF